MVYRDLTVLIFQVVSSINNIFTENLNAFHDEKDAFLQAGIKQADYYFQADDTKTRHVGKNGYCMHIGNELFAWFKSTESKSRVNFLELLYRGDRVMGHFYVIIAR